MGRGVMETPYRPNERQQVVPTHNYIAGLVASAVQGAVGQPAGLAALAPDSQPLPHLGPRTLTIALPGHVDPHAAAQRASKELAGQHLLHTSPPAAHGPVITAAIPACLPNEFPAAAAVTAWRARQGWAAKDTQQQRQLATLANLPQSHCIVMLEPGQELSSLQCEAGSAAMAAQLTVAAWDRLAAGLAARGLRHRPRLLASLLRAADTMAAVAADVALLPLADTSGDSSGVPSLGLWCATVAMEAAAASQAAAEALCAVQSPAGAWSWVQAYAAAHATSAAAQAHLGSWLPGERRWLVALLQHAASVRLRISSAVPALESGWGVCSFLHPPAAAGFGSTTLLLVAPRKKRAALSSLPQAAVGAAVAATPGAQLAWGPLEVRQILASRHGCQLLAVAGMDGAKEETWANLQAAISSCCATGPLVLRVEQWRSAAYATASGGGLPAGTWNSLAAALRNAVDSSKSGRRRGPAEEDSEQEEEEDEQDHAEHVAQLRSCPPGRFGTLMARPLLKGTRLEGNLGMVRRLEAIFPASSGGSDWGKGGHGDGSGGTSTSSSDDGSSDSGGSKLSNDALLLRTQMEQYLGQQLAVAAGGGGGPPGGGGGRCIHILDRASSQDGPGGLGTTIGKQAAGVGAALGCILPLGVPCRVRLWLEVGSTFVHSLLDRNAFMEMAAAVEPGDIVLLPCLSRLGRLLAEQQAGLALLASRGATVLVLAIGSTPAAPVAVLAVPAGADGADQLSEEAPAAIARLQSVLVQVADVTWAISTEHGLYASEQAFMQRVLGASPPAADPRRLLLAELCHGRRIYILARSSEPVEQGGVQACAGAAASGSMEQGSLSRQQAVCAVLLEGSDLPAPKLLQFNGTSVAGAAAADFPLLEMMGTKQLPAGSIVLATASHRLSRCPGLLQRLISRAQEHSIDIVILLPDCSVLDALQQGEGYAANALGSQLCRQASTSEEGHQALQQLNVVAERDHSLVRPAANSSPVLLPVALTRCSEPVLSAFLAAEQRAGAFASGFRASFSDALDPRLQAAAAQGFAAYQQAVPASAPGQRGLSPGQEEAAVVGLKAALAAQSGSQPESLAVEVALGRRSSGSRDWQCRTCRCAPGNPSLQCRCDCQKCRRARESLCRCSAACDHGGACICPPACPCCCKACHNGSPCGNGCGGGAAGGDGTGSSEASGSDNGGGGAGANSTSGSGACTDGSSSSHPAAPPGTICGGSREDIVSGSGNGSSGRGGMQAAKAGGCSEGDASQDCKAQKPQCLHCGKSFSRAMQQVCSMECYAAWCTANNKEPRRCSNAENCMDPNGPGMAPVGFVGGSQCPACFKHRKNEKQNAKRRAGAAAQAAAAAAAAAGATAANPAAPADSSRGDGGGNPKKRRKSPAEGAATVRMKWQSSETMEALVKSAEAAVAAGVPPPALLPNLTWGEDTVDRKLSSANTQQLSGAWRRLSASAHDGTCTCAPALRERILAVAARVRSTGGGCG